MHREEREYNKLIEELEIQKAQLEVGVRGAQSAAKVMMEQNKTYAVSDSVVKNWFDGKSALWYTWARQFARDSQEPMAPIVTWPPTAIHELDKVVFTKNRNLPREFERMGNNKKAHLLLHGLLTNFICTEIFGSPWWVFKAMAYSLSAATQAPSDYVNTDRDSLGSGTGDPGKGVDRHSGPPPNTRVSQAAVFSNMGVHMDALYGALQEGKQSYLPSLPSSPAAHR